jgi:deoxyadenosine/deoxycytidine kinase
LLERCQAAAAASPGVRVFERSIRVSREVFVEEAKGLLDQEDLTFLYRLCAYGEETHEKQAVTFYLACSYTECLRRVRSRARPSEENLR